MTKILNIDNNPNNFKLIENLNPNDITIIGVVWKEYDSEGGTQHELEFGGDYEIAEDSKDFDLFFQKLNKKDIRCNHCNKRIQYVMLGLHTDGSVHSFGHRCTENMTYFTGVSFTKAHKKSLASLVREKNRLNREKILNKYDGLREALQIKNKIIIDIRENFIQYGNLSEKQVELVFKMKEQHEKFQAETNDREESAEDVPEQRIDSEFTIISIRKEICSFSQNNIYKAVIENNTGKYRVFGNLPVSSIEDTETPLIVGDVIKGKVTLTKSDKNPKFGFFKRLTLAK